MVAVFGADVDVVEFSLGENLPFFKFAVFGFAFVGEEFLAAAFEAGPAEPEGAEFAGDFDLGLMAAFDAFAQDLGHLVTTVEEDALVFDFPFFLDGGELVEGFGLAAGEFAGLAIEGAGEYGPVEEFEVALAVGNEDAGVFFVPGFAGIVEFLGGGAVFGFDDFGPGAATVFLIEFLEGKAVGEFFGGGLRAQVLHDQLTEGDSDRGLGGPLETDPFREGSRGDYAAVLVPAAGFDLDLVGRADGEVGVAIVEGVADFGEVLDAMVAVEAAVMGGLADFFVVPAAVGFGDLVGVPGEAGVGAGGGWGSGERVERGAWSVERIEWFEIFGALARKLEGLVRAARRAGIVQSALVGLFVFDVVIVVFDAALSHEDDFSVVGVLLGAVHGLANEAVEGMEPGFVHDDALPAQGLHVAGVQAADGNSLVGQFYGGLGFVVAVHAFEHRGDGGDGTKEAEGAIGIEFGFRIVFQEPQEVAGVVLGPVGVADVCNE